MIKVTRLSEPTREEIKVVCPTCGFIIYRYVSIKKKSGKSSCGICGTKFKWEETDD